MERLAGAGRLDRQVDGARTARIVDPDVIAVVRRRVEVREREVEVTQRQIVRTGRGDGVEVVLGREVRVTGSARERVDGVGMRPVVREAVIRTARRLAVLEVASVNRLGHRRVGRRRRRRGRGRAEQGPGRVRP